jgi:putative ATP-dependent endonuclease of OLD family
MNITKVIIENYKCFEGKFELKLNSGLNILVGDNEVGKSTILEAINLALSGCINGRYLSTELKESLFNKKVVDSYLGKINLCKDTELPPSIIIEIHLDFGIEELNAKFTGDKNFDRDRKAVGLRFEIFFDEEKSHEYIEEIIKSGQDLHSLPIEFCEFSWHSFAREPKIPRTIPLKASLIDSSSFRYKNGSDISASKIIRDRLTPEEEAKISQAHRKLKDVFAEDQAIQDVNKKIKQDLSEKNVSLQIETSTKMSWESSLIPYVDDIPFQNIGKGEQCLIKTRLSLQHKRTKNSNVLLIEEPENHLSHSKLNELINHIKNNHKEKQVVISTHSSFVANKIGLDNLILLNVDLTNNKRKETRITALEPDTQNYFQKLAGYDTLRFILCKKAILVEGDSDELIIQAAYFSKNKKIPIEDGIDVISVRSLAFKRFLDLSKELRQPTVVVTDNDGDFDNKVQKKYKYYEKFSHIRICADPRNNLKTLEPQLVEANKDQLGVLRSVLGISETKYPDQYSLSNYMEDSNHKTKCALKIFDAIVSSELDSEQFIAFPKYIENAISENE